MPTRWTQRHEMITAMLPHADQPATGADRTSPNLLVLGDNLPLLESLPSASVPLIYIDPPSNIGTRQVRPQFKTIQDAAGDRTGFGGKRYRTEKLLSTAGYHDRFDDFLGFLRPRLVEAHRVLTPTGSLFFHIDPREVHYCKGPARRDFYTALLPERDHLGLRLWSARDEPLARQARHDPLVHPRPHAVYLKSRRDRPHPVHGSGSGGGDEGRSGQDPTDVWWHTIVSPTGKEKTGYATQKPLSILERIVRVHSNPDDLVLDCFAGSGTTGEAAARNDRRFLLIDQKPEAVAIMQRRLARYLQPAAAAGL